MIFHERLDEIKLKFLFIKVTFVFSPPEVIFIKYKIIDRQTHHRWGLEHHLETLNQVHRGMQRHL